MSSLLNSLTNTSPPLAASLMNMSGWDLLVLQATVIAFALLVTSVTTSLSQLRAYRRANVKRRQPKMPARDYAAYRKER